MVPYFSTFQAHLVERQVFALRKLTRSAKYGFVCHPIFFPTIIPPYFLILSIKFILPIFSNNFSSLILSTFLYSLMLSFYLPSFTLEWFHSLYLRVLPICSTWKISHTWCVFSACCTSVTHKHARRTQTKCPKKVTIAHRWRTGLVPPKWLQRWAPLFWWRKHPRRTGCSTKLPMRSHRWVPFCLCCVYCMSIPSVTVLRFEK